MNISIVKKIRCYSALMLCGLILLTSCTNNVDEGENEIIFPKSLTIEKILGITWKADRYSMKIINPKLELDKTPAGGTGKLLPKDLKQLAVITDKLFNSITFSKVGDISVSYVVVPEEETPNFFGVIKNSVFYYNGKWKLNENNQEELFAKIDSPAGILEFKIKIKELSLLNNTLIMEAYFLNPKYSFSILFSGNGPQEQYWNKETDVADPSWTERNQVSEELLSYGDITGTYQADMDDWKRVVYIDNITTNIYPLLSKYKLSFESNGSVLLNGLPYYFFGANTYNGTWTIDKNRVLMDFPLFPFLGDVHAYSSVFEISDDGPFTPSRYARHNAGITMEIVKIEKERMLVKFTEIGVCSAYVYLNKTSNNFK